METMLSNSLTAHDTQHGVTEEFGLLHTYVLLNKYIFKY